MIKNNILKQLNKRKLSFLQLVKKLEVRSDVLENELKSLMDQGLIFYDGNEYALLSDYGLKFGRVVLRKRTFAYVEVKDDEKDYRLSGKMVAGLIVGDYIYVEANPSFSDCHFAGFYKRKESLIGKFIQGKKNGSSYGSLLCSEVGESEIKVVVTKIDDSFKDEIVDGDTCYSIIEDFDRSTIYVKIVSVLVSANEVGSDISDIIVTNGARLVFPDNVKEEVAKLPQEVRAKDYDGRVDLTSHLIVTIDGEDALDFDDAVEVERINDAYKVGVHIADVSFYVKENTEIDKEAYLRGTSIYVADRVVPMLPKELSNGICSLNPNVERLTLSIYLYIDKYGNVFKHEIHPAVIKSKARMTYKQVNSILEGKNEGYSEDIIDLIKLLYEVSQKIRKRRNNNGCLNLSTTEVKFRLDENNEPQEVIKLVQGKGEKLIEDLMIAANVEVANAFVTANVPTLFRIHELPKNKKIESLKSSLLSLNLLNNFPSVINPKSLNFWLLEFKDEGLKNIASDLLLRSLAKARYSAENLSHFGLNEKNYLHFTSPIRRYPDLIVHRLVKQYLLDDHNFNKTELENLLEVKGNLLSELERQAQRIEREVEDLETCKYYAKRIGEVYQGTVTSITNYGLYLELENGLEVLLLMEYISGTNAFVFDEKIGKCICRKTKEEYGLGSKIEVKIFEVDFTRKDVIVQKSDYIAETNNVKELNAERSERTFSSHKDGKKSRFHDKSTKNNGFRKEYNRSKPGDKRGKSFRSNRKPSFRKRGANEKRR